MPESVTTENKPIDLVDKRITDLSIGRAQFCLRALMLAGHVSRETMGHALALAETLRFDHDN